MEREGGREGSKQRARHTERRGEDQVCVCVCERDKEAEKEEEWEREREIRKRQK